MAKIDLVIPPDVAKKVDEIQAAADQLIQAMTVLVKAYTAASNEANKLGKHGMATNLLAEATKHNDLIASTRTQVEQWHEEFTSIFGSGTRVRGPSF